MLRSIHLAIFAGILLLAGVVGYFPGLHGPLFFDDKPALTGNELAKIDGTCLMTGGRQPSVLSQGRCGDLSRCCPLLPIM